MVLFVIVIRVYPCSSVAKELFLRGSWRGAILAGTVVVAAAIVAIVTLRGTLGIPVVQDGSQNPDSIFRKALGGGDQRVARGPRVWDKETGKLVKEN